MFKFNTIEAARSFVNRAEKIWIIIQLWDGMFQVMRPVDVTRNDLWDHAI